MTPEQQATALHEIKYDLHSSYVRFIVSWNEAQPTQGPFDPSSDYMQHVYSAVSLAKQDGLNVLITFEDVPRWASDHAYWGKWGGYQPYVAMNTAYLPDYQAFCQEVATQLRGMVFAYECWNEPNLYLFLYPQSTSADKYFGAHLYVKMLRRFFYAVRTGDPAAKVMAGGTAPYGHSEAYAYSSSPQRFGAAVKSAGVGSYFDAYSHHPYMAGASPRLWPEAAPGNPKTTVTLQNLGTLLKLFPKKPFYLTEYGYQTRACQAFSGQHVDQPTQADYLQRAYTFARRYPQVKMLMWYLLQDNSPPGAPYQGFYTGLRSSNGDRKRAWYAFAGQNALTLSGPSSVKHGATFSFSGELSCAGAGVGGQSLLLQRRSSTGSWSTIATVTSAAAGVYTTAGSYTAQVKPKASASYRITWSGVVTGRTVRVTVN